MYKFILAFLAYTFVANNTFAQDIHLNKPIEKKDIIGTWMVTAFLPGSFGEENPTSDLLAATQIIGFYEDGHVRTLASDYNKKMEYNLIELEARFGAREANLNYHFLKKGLIAITIDDKKQLGTLWQTHQIQEPGLFNGVNTLQGDIIMGMTPLKGSKNDNFRYIRIMRPIQ